MPLIDKKRLEKLRGEIGPDALGHVIQAFRDELKMTLKALESLGSQAADLDHQGLADLAHTLKSTSATFGATRLNLSAQSLEEAANKESDDTVKKLILEVSQIASEVIDFFSVYTDENPE